MTSADGTVTLKVDGKPVGEYVAPHAFTSKMANVSVTIL